MDNYVLFRQAICLVLFFETLVLWPRFKLYFGPQVFPRSVFTSSFRIHAFQILLLTCLIFLFLDYYAIFASFILFLCMRYLFVSGRNTRVSTFGAVGQVCLLISAYIFFFEVALMIDPTYQLVEFFHNILAIEVGIILLSSGIHKCLLGYLNDEGFEYALVNPSWGKFFFFFRKLRPSSWFFKINNFGACFLEILTGLCFLLPETRIFGAYLLIFIFLYVFLTVRVNILPFLMMGIALLYLKPIDFHFPILSKHPSQLVIPEFLITLIEAFFILYLIVYILITFYRIFQLIMKVPVPSFLIKPMQIFMFARPYFEWNVFNFKFTNYFIQIQKTSKTTKEMTATIYDGFSKNYGEIFEDPRLFFRFIHHHESSLLLNLFDLIIFSKYEDMEPYQKQFIKKIVWYSKTLLTKSEHEDTLVVFTAIHIMKTEDKFFYVPGMSISVDVKSGTVIRVR